MDTSTLTPGTILDSFVEPSVGVDPVTPTLADDRVRCFHGILSASPAMHDLFRVCQQVGETEAPVLILGETGTGKELLANAIHAESHRTGRFVPLDCGAIPAGLVESELFGHAKGSFTGATARKAGMFREAQGGTLFMDEIGNLPLPAQHSLLRVLQEHVVRPVGSVEEIAVDARVVAATSQDLDAAVADSEFREDLMYRLDVIRLIVPPLRERPGDVRLLFDHFLRELCEEHLAEPPQLSDGFMERVVAHDWPGNVRELLNFCERLVLTRAGRELDVTHFGRLHTAYRPRAATSAASNGEPAQQAPSGGRSQGDAEGEGLITRCLADLIDTERSLEECLQPIIDCVERTYIERALREHHGAIKRCAQASGISRRTLLRKLKRLGIDRRDYCW